MGSSKKVVVAFDPEKPEKSSSDFLVPVVTEKGEVEFLGTKSGANLRYGLVILTSRSVSENDLFAKLVDTGRAVANVADCLKLLSNFLDAMSTVKIGNVIEITGGSNGEVVLGIVSNTPSGFPK
jgi:hypothetical protein